MHIIGLDAHSATFTMAFLTERGKIKNCLSRDTSAENLIELATSVKGPKTLIVEESHVAQWVKSVLEAFVDKLIVCDPKENRWIARDDFIDDRKSAIKLAELYLVGKIKEIYHPDNEGAAVKSLFLHYYDITHQSTRFKNKLKSYFRQAGIKLSGSGVYKMENSDKYLEELSFYPHLRSQAKHIYPIIESLELIRNMTRASMVRKVRKNPAYSLLQGMPGVGPVISCGYIALIFTPHRFSRKNKLWRYANLGNVYHVSDGKVYKNKKSKSGNRVLKWLVYQHFQKSVELCKQPNRFKIKYQELRSKGLSHKVARRHVCRSILSVVRTIWMKEEAYQDKFN
jgi:transposase